MAKGETSQLSGRMKLVAPEGEGHSLVRVVGSKDSKRWGNGVLKCVVAVSGRKGGQTGKFRSPRCQMT